MGFVSMIQADLNFLTNTLVGLVKINSMNPALSAEGRGEFEIASFVKDLLSQSGMQATLYPLGENRANAVGVRKGRGGGKTLMWNAHMDTVGSNGMEDPFSAQIIAGKLYGRGSQDMKGSLAAMIAAAHALETAGIQLDGDLILAAVSDEEYSSIGTADLIKHYRADAAIVPEPTNMELCLAHRGVILYEVETFGKAAHGSRYLDGVDAIAHMGRFLNELDQLGQNLITRPPHPLVGPPSLHASIIEGGSGTNTYPAYCRLIVERRTSPGEQEDQVTAEFQAIIDRLAAQDSLFKAKLRPYQARVPYEIDPNAEIVQMMKRIIQDHTGRSAVISGASYWTDAALLAEAGVPSVVIGPTGEGLHSAEEWVDLQSCLDLANLLIRSAIEFCTV